MTQIEIMCDGDDICNSQRNKNRRATRPIWTPLVPADDRVELTIDYTPHQ